MSAVGDASRTARKAQLASEPWVERLARLGYAAKGIVYVIMGVLAEQAAAGAGSAKVDQKSAFLTILDQPFGKFLLGVVALGLAGYALWRFIQAIADPEHDGKKKDGALKRVGYAISGVSYGVLCAAAVRLLLGQGNAGASKGPQDWTAGLLSHPLGRWLVVLAGLLVLGVGALQVYQAYNKKFEQRFEGGKLSATGRRRLVLVGRIGYTAKGVVLALIGVFLLQAALQVNPQKAAGLGDALARLASQPYGVYLLALVAAGLVAYGLYAMFLSQFRRINVW